MASYTASGGVPVVTFVGQATQHQSEEKPTIKGLVVECHKGQQDIKAELERHFKRDVEKDNTSPTPRLNKNNVLDDIIEELMELKNEQEDMIKFIASSINAKL